MQAPYLSQMQLTNPWCSSSSTEINQKQGVSNLLYAGHHTFLRCNSPIHGSPHLPQNQTKRMMIVSKLIQEPNLSQSHLTNPWYSSPSTRYNQKQGEIPNLMQGTIPSSDANHKPMLCSSTECNKKLGEIPKIMFETYFPRKQLTNPWFSSTS